MALEDARDDDPTTGWQVGPNEIVCRLSHRHYLALRGEQGFVVLERLDVEPGDLPELMQHAEATANTRHPNLARVLGCDTAEEGTFWATEYVPGATLTEVRAACKKAGKSLPVGLALAAIHETALALGELHSRRRSHGNLRDSHLLVGVDGKTRVLNPGVRDSIQRLPPDPVIDVWALANLLYECLTGQTADGPAFAAPSSFNHALEKPIDDLLQRALGPERALRFKNASDFAQALRTAASGYMWKPAQRAEYVLNLFRKRQQRGLQLTQSAAGRLAELRQGRAAQLAVAEAARAHQAFIAQAPLSHASAGEEAEMRRYVGRLVPPPAVYSVPKRALMLGAAALVGIAACVSLVNVINGRFSGPSTAVMAPPIPVLVPMVAAAAPAVAQAAAAEAAPAEAVAMASADGDEASEPAQPETPKVKKKKKVQASADDAPLPPWLMRKGRR